MPASIKLVSDFTDYYDSAFRPDGTLEYRRLQSECMSKGKALDWLKLHNIPTLETKPVREFSRFDSKIVVYTDTKLHMGKGKIICSYQEAIDNYPNYLGAPYIEGTDGLTLKFLQIGSRRFRIMFKNPKYDFELNSGGITSIEELRPEYNYSISIPIFSIDYIPRNNSMIAVDFNEVQPLYYLGIDKFLTPGDVRNEVEKFMKRAN